MVSEKPLYPPPQPRHCSTLGARNQTVVESWDLREHHGVVMEAGGKEQRGHRLAAGPGDIPSILMLNDVVS